MSESRPRSFFSLCCSCFIPNSNSSIRSNINPPPLASEIQENLRHNRPINKKKVIESSLKVDTNKKDLKLMMTQEKPITPMIHIYPYFCPLCFQYFNKILKTSCCNNYICELCVGLVNKRKKFVNENRCFYCNNKTYLLKDVEEHEPIKKYTDSPYIEKIFAQTRKKNKNSHFNNKGEFTLQEIKEKVKETKETENVTEFRSKSVEINKTKFSIKKRAHSLNIINEEFYKDKKPEEILKDFVFRKNNYLTN